MHACTYVVTYTLWEGFPPSLPGDSTTISRVPILLPPPTLACGNECSELGGFFSL